MSTPMPPTTMRSTVWLERAGWECNKPGWWTHPEYGGICLERDRRWYAYPLCRGTHGPFRNCVDAARCCAKTQLARTTKHPDNMQLKKHNWKKLRNQIPCRECGEKHETKCCVQRNGKKQRTP